MNQSEPFGFGSGRKQAYAGSVAAGPIQALDQTNLHRIATRCKYDRDGGCSRFGGKG